MVTPAVNGPEVTRVLTSETSAAGVALPPLPVLSVLLEGFGSVSAGVAVALLWKDAAAVGVAGRFLVTFAPETKLAIVHGSAAHPPPDTFVMVKFVGVWVTGLLVGVGGPAWAEKGVWLIVGPGVKGREVTRFLTSETSAEAPAPPPLPVLSVLFEVFGSGCAAVAVALLSKAPGAFMVAGPLMGTFGPRGRLAMGPGNAGPPPPLPQRVR